MSLPSRQIARGNTKINALTPPRDEQPSAAAWYSDDAMSSIRTRDSSAQQLPRPQGLGYLIGFGFYWVGAVSRFVFAIIETRPGTPVAAGPSILLWIALAGFVIMIAVGYRLARAGLMHRTSPWPGLAGRAWDWISFMVKIVFGYFIAAAIRGLLR